LEGGYLLFGAGLFRGLDALGVGLGEGREEEVGLGLRFVGIGHRIEEGERIKWGFYPGPIFSFLLDKTPVSSSLTNRSG
jgi:hypothetical protein